MEPRESRGQAPHSSLTLPTPVFALPRETGMKQAIRRGSSCDIVISNVTDRSLVPVHCEAKPEAVGCGLRRGGLMEKLETLWCLALLPGGVRDGGAHSASGRFSLQMWPGEWPLLVKGVALGHRPGLRKGVGL